MKQVVQNYRTGQLKVEELPPPLLTHKRRDRANDSRNSAEFAFRKSAQPARSGPTGREFG
jgi:hypothetical protein